MDDEIVGTPLLYTKRFASSPKWQAQDDGSPAGVHESVLRHPSAGGEAGEAASSPKGQAQASHEKWWVWCGRASKNFEEERREMV